MLRMELRTRHGAEGRLCGCRELGDRGDARVVGPRPRTQQVLFCFSVVLPCCCKSRPIEGGLRLVLPRPCGHMKTSHYGATRCPSEAAASICRILSDILGNSIRTRSRSIPGICHAFPATSSPEVVGWNLSKSSFDRIEVLRLVAARAWVRVHLDEVVSCRPGTERYLRQRGMLRQGSKESAADRLPSSKQAGGTLAFAKPLLALRALVLSEGGSSRTKGKRECVHACWLRCHHGTGDPLDILVDIAADYKGGLVAVFPLFVPFAATARAHGLSFG
mmetsp:Transcript_96356/g.210720  ORF Transcript_96356/g.210720 Transcript_96356/m.210720 type:complete len:276 (-) Transcript_96356:176-1003(-)